MYEEFKEPVESISSAEYGEPRGLVEPQDTVPPDKCWLILFWLAVFAFGQITPDGFFYESSKIKTTTQADGKT